MAIFNSYVTNYQRVQNRGKTHQNLWDFFATKRDDLYSGYPPLVMTPGGLLGKSSVTKHVQKAMPKSITRGYIKCMPKSIPGFDVLSFLALQKTLKHERGQGLVEACFSHYCFVPILLRHTWFVTSDGTCFSHHGDQSETKHVA